MERRWLGLVVVIAVLIGGLTLCRLLGPGLAGAPVAQPPPGPPGVGDCVLSRDLVPYWFVDSPEVEPPTARIQPCTGDRFGEVVAVLATPDREDPAPGTDPTGSPEYRRCVAETDDYLGQPTDTGTGPLSWKAQSVHLILVSGPDLRQRAAGQSWTACLVSPGWETIDTTVPDEKVSVTSTFHDAFRDPVLRDRLGYCFAGQVEEVEQIPCNRPHDHQYLGFATVVADLDRATAEQSCADWISTVTDLPDPTADGALAAVLAAYDLDGMLTSAELLGPGSYVDCSASVTGDRQLVGSLLGLGGAAIPWA